VQCDDVLAQDLVEAVQSTFCASTWLLLIDDVWNPEDMSADLGLGLLSLDAGASSSSIVVTSRLDLAYDWHGCTSIKLTEESYQACAEKMLAGFVLPNVTSRLPSEIAERPVIFANYWNGP